MDEERLQPHSHFLPIQSGKRVDNGGNDRISELPNEVLVKILSLLPVRRAASTTLLSSRWLDLWKQIPNLKFNLESDRISQLPDQIISVILSFLPLKQAATISVLSSRWPDSWKNTPNLNFDRDIVPNFYNIIPNFGPRNSMCKYMELVNSILESHKALSLKQFRISLLCENKSVKGAVIKWLEKCAQFVFMRKVESLELKCWADRDNVVFGELLREIYGNPRSLTFFESLKSLELVYLEVSGEDIELFLRNCPLLEVLLIHDVSFTSDIEVCGPSLKRLEICECSGGKSIKVSAPNLTFIKFDDDEVGKLMFENVPRLVHATFDIITSENIMHHFASAASFHISQLQFLRINLHNSKVFWTNGFPQMPNLKKLVISSTYNQSLQQVTRLIWASPRLEEFKFKFGGFFKAATANVQEMANVGRSPHRHLKVFHLVLASSEMGVEYHDEVVELVTYVSNNCTALSRIDIVGSAPRLLQTQLELPNHVQLSIRPRF